MDDMTPMFGITEADRLRVFREDDEALAELARITHARAIADNGKTVSGVRPEITAACHLIVE